MWLELEIYVRQSLGPITPRACTNAAESAIYFYPGKDLWKKDLEACLAIASGVDSNWVVYSTTSVVCEWGYVV